MGMISHGNVTICGNFTKAKRYKKTPSYLREWKAIIPYPFKWRDKICGITCTCEEVVQTHQPYYGSNWYHEDKCAIMQYYEKYPTRFNFAGGDPSLMAQSE